jgi:hypothetical protein
VDTLLVQHENLGDSEKALSVINCVKSALLQSWRLRTSEKETKESHGDVCSHFIEPLAVYPSCRRKKRAACGATGGGTADAPLLN